MPRTTPFYTCPVRDALMCDIRTACEDTGMLALAGEHGSGKTTLIREAIRGFGHIVHVRNIARARTTGGHILDALAADLTGTMLYGSLERRSRHVRDALMGMHASGERGVLICDNAHLIPPSTLSDLVRIHALCEHRPLAVIVAGSLRLGHILSTPTLASLYALVVGFSMPALDLGGYMDWGQQAMPGWDRLLPAAIGVILDHPAATTPAAINRLVRDALMHANRISERDVCGEIVEISLGRAA